MMRGKGGLYAYTGTTDARIVEKEILNGNEEWKVIYQAMALQEAKAIAALAATAKGKVDCIALSGGLSYSEMFVNWIREYVGFIAPIYVFPGEFEMEAMAMSVLNAVEGKAPVCEFTIFIIRKIGPRMMSIASLIIMGLIAIFWGRSASTAQWAVCYIIIQCCVQMITANASMTLAANW